MDRGPGGRRRALRGVIDVILYRGGQFHPRQESKSPNEAHRRIRNHRRRRKNAGQDRERPCDQVQQIVDPGNVVGADSRSSSDPERGKARPGCEPLEPAQAGSHRDAPRSRARATVRTRRPAAAASASPKPSNNTTYKRMPSTLGANLPRRRSQSPRSTPGSQVRSSPTTIQIEHIRWRAGGQTTEQGKNGVTVLHQ